jgi:pantothenate kinase-related protein Tda10
MTRGEFTALLVRWLEDAANSASPTEKPIVIGMSGAQGLGKTTLMAHVCVQILASGVRVCQSASNFGLTHFRCS